MARRLAIYAAVNLLLIVVWAISGAGYFWPVWPLLGWGLGLAKHHMRHGGATGAVVRSAE
ncbi:MAG: 2TM domain-containing protein [Thermoleophilaceae bacterium]|nr:2TM domain-containing protein [Thermoleophilaceae bacterium]